MKFLHKLLALADKLDSSGLYKEAGVIDNIIRDAGFLDLFKGTAPSCTCQCGPCASAKEKIESSGIKPGMGGYAAIISSHCKQLGSGCKFGN